jgi:hypothetical protein
LEGYKEYNNVLLSSSSSSKRGLGITTHFEAKIDHFTFIMDVLALVCQLVYKIAFFLEIYIAAFLIHVAFTYFDSFLFSHISTTFLCSQIFIFG